MSKNLTRKGLALGALVALASSVFAGSPALAADSMVLAANSTDTTIAAPIDQVLELNASLGAGSTAANIATLKYKIVTDGTFVAKAEASSTGAGPAVVKYTTYSKTSITTLTDMFKAGGTATDRAVTSVVVAATSSDATRANILKVSVATVPDAPNTADNGRAVASTDASRSVTVTAFLDANNNDTLDSGETQQEQVVKFVAYKDITTTTTITSPLAGDTTVTATVKFTNVNNEQLTDANVGALFTNGTGTALGAATGDAIRSGATAAYAWSSTNDGFKFVSGTISAGLPKDSAVKVQPLLGTAAVSGIGTVAAAKSIYVGTAQTSAVTTRTIGEFSANTVKSITSATLATAVTGTVGGADNSGTTVNAALNLEKQVAFKALDTADVPAALAGQAVAVTITSSVALSATKTLTVNGTTYTSSAALPGATGVAKLALTTGADGKAVITYKTAGFANGNTVSFSGLAANFTAKLIVTEATRVFLAATSYIENHESASAYKAVTTDGVAVPVNVVVLDQFGGTPGSGTLAVTATLTGTSTQATTAATSASNTFAPVVDGKASLSILDNGTGLGVNTYTIAVYETATNGVMTALSGGFSVSFPINIVAATDVAAGTVKLYKADWSAVLTQNTSKVYQVAGSAKGSSADADRAALTYSTFSAADLRKIAVTAPSRLAANGTTGTEADRVDISGIVSSTETATYAAVAIPGSVVTIKGTGLLFAATEDGARIYAADSITTVANEDGKFVVGAWSHKAGKQTVTVTSGTGTASIDVYFKAAAAYDASAVTVKVADGAAQFQAGRALDVTLTVTDKFDNPVATSAVDATASTAAVLRIAQTGSGYLANTGKIVTAADGTYSTKLITNAGDLGTSTITATLDWVDTTVTDVVKTVSSEFGVTDADVTVGGRAVYASVEFAKGKTVTVSVDGKRLYSKLFSTDAYTELKFTQKKAGKHVVTVRVSGGIVYSETVTTTK